MDRSIQEMRIDVYARIAEACMVYDLPAPKDIAITDFGMTSVDLILDDDRPEQVDAWAEFMSLPLLPDRLIGSGGRPWVRHKAEAVDHSGGLWRGFQMANVWCAVKDPEQVARLSALAVLGA